MLSSAEKRELAARGHHLKAHVSIAGGELSDAVVEHVRRAFGDKELLKIRVSTDEREECAATVQRLAKRVPCDVVQVVGRVALLHRAVANDGVDDAE